MDAELPPEIGLDAVDCIDQLIEIADMVDLSDAEEFCISHFLAQLPPERAQSQFTLHSTSPNTRKL